jgi:hypothetical protein
MRQREEHRDNVRRRKKWARDPTLNPRLKWLRSGRIGPYSGSDTSRGGPGDPGGMGEAGGVGGMGSMGGMGGAGGMSGKGPGGMWAWTVSYVF